MKYLMFGHRLIFALMLCSAFWAGALDAGRRDIVSRLTAEQLLSLTLNELSNVQVM